MHTRLSHHGGSLSLTETAVCLGISYRTLTELIKSGKIAATYTGANRRRARFVTVEEIDRFRATLPKSGKGVANVNR